MATVYLAQDVRHKRLVALKVLHPALAQTLGSGRFQREIELAARLQHPHILTVHDSGSAAGQLWYSMPYVEGESLRDRLEREKQLPIEDAVRIATEIARALDYAHRHGVVHRDIKPENILLTKDGDTLIADFGIARALDASAYRGDARLTDTGMAIGTPVYMSPEQATGDPVDARTDVYALGCLLYEMLAGEPPFTGPTAQAIIGRRLSGEAPSVSLLRPAVPDHLRRAVAKALASLPVNRFQTAAEFAEALAARPESAPASARPRVPSAVIFVLGLLVTATMGFLLWARNDRPSVPSRDGPAAGSSPSRPIAQPSVAVLPFANLSPDAANEYFSDGMTEELISALSRVEGLRVAARASSFAFKGKPLDLQEVARGLKVGAVLNGSVRRVGQRLRVTAELVDVHDGSRLWADSYDRELKDVFAVHDELTRAIVGALQVPLKLTGRSDTALVRVGTRDPVAHDLYLRGRFLWNQRNYDGLRRAVGYFEQAIRRDSSYAQAYAGLADAYLLLPPVGQARPADGFLKAKHAVERALTLDSTLAEGHASLALLRVYDYDWQGAEAGFRRAIALNPSYATGHQWYAMYLGTVGRQDEALAEIQLAHTLDPLSRIMSNNLGMRLMSVGRYDEAVRQLRSTAELYPNSPQAYGGLCYIYAVKGLPREAISACERALALSSPREAPMGLLAYVQVAAGNRLRAAAIVRELEERARREYVSPVQIAYGYLALGDVDRTLAWLDSAYASHDLDLAPTTLSPLWDPMRADPRFARLRARMGLPP